MAENLTLEQLRAGDTPQQPTRLPKNEIKWWQVSSIQASKISYGDFQINKGELTIGTGEGVFKADGNGIYLGSATYGTAPFRVDMSGNLYAENVNLAGEINATSGTIGGFTITPTTMYGGIIKTGQTVGAGESGVIMDTDGLRGYSNVLGEVFNLPTDGSAPSFSSGVIENTIFEINTSAVIRTSDDVGVPVENITELVSDSFTTLSGDWTEDVSITDGDSVAPTVVVDGDVDFSLASMSAGKYGYYDLIRSAGCLTPCVSMKISALEAMDNSGYASAGIAVMDVLGESTLYAGIFVEDTDGVVTISIQVVDNSASAPFIYFNGAYDFVTNPYIRVRIMANGVFFESSTNGTDWDEITSTTETLGFTANPYVLLEAYGEDNEVSVVFDNFVLSQGTVDGGAGILVNNTGLYACEEGQTLADANVKILANGEATFSGSVKGGMDDFMTGEGYFMGLSGNVYKLSVGSPSGNYMSWDNEQLRIKGIIELDGPINLEGYATADLPIPPSSPGLSLAGAYE